MFIPNGDSAFKILVVVTTLVWGLGTPFGHSRPTALFRPIALFLTGYMLEHYGRQEISPPLLWLAYYTCLVGGLWLIAEIVIQIRRRLPRHRAQKKGNVNGKDSISCPLPTPKR